MSDRCSLTITVRKDDLPKLAEAMNYTEAEIRTARRSGVTIEEAEDGAVTLYFDEVDYGLYVERQELAKSDVPHYGWHGDGGNYSATAFVAADGEWAEILRAGDDIVAPVNEKGEIDNRYRKEIQLYYRLLKRAGTLIHGK